MKIIDQLVHGSGQPNLALIDRLVAIERKTWIIASVAAALLLFFSLVPLLLGQAANSSTLYGANTAILIMLAVTLIWVNQTQKNRSRMWIAMCITAAMFSMAAYLLLDAWLKQEWIFSAIIVSASAFEPLTEFNIQTFVFFLLFGVLTCLEGALDKQRWKYLDILALALAFNVLLLFFGFSLDLLAKNTQGMNVFYGICVLISASSLSYASLCRRVQAGIFTIFVSVGIGSEVARKVLPILVSLPLLIVGFCIFVENFNFLSLVQVATLTAATTACALIYLSMRIANYVNSLEKNLLDMSLIDDLTGIYNRRGFYLLGEHILEEGKRSGEPVMVLFFDLDGLKEVNDTLGHETGSNLLTEFASLLRANFRSCDVVARVGGDEFAVVTQQDAYKIVLNRLKNSVEANNRTLNKAYKIRYSVGVATTGKTRGDEKFADLVKEADALMYQRKKQKHARPQGNILNPLAPLSQ